MTGRYLAPRPTPCTMEQVYAALRRARTDLPNESLLVLLAQISLESGDGASMVCYSIAGVKAQPGGDVDFTFYGTDEHAKRPDGTTEVTHYPAPSADEITSWLAGGRELTTADLQTCFAAFESLDAAIAHYLVKLLSDGYIDAWQHVIAGDALAFGRALGDRIGKRYMSADPDAYGRALATRVEWYARRVPKWRADA